MRISDWSSDVCSSDLSGQDHPARQPPRAIAVEGFENRIDKRLETDFPLPPPEHRVADLADEVASHLFHDGRLEPGRDTEEVKQIGRSEEHTSELQSLMRIPYAVFCLKTKNYSQ